MIRRPPGSALFPCTTLCRSFERLGRHLQVRGAGRRCGDDRRDAPRHAHRRSEEHTSELQSQSNLVCRLLLEKKKKHILPVHPTFTPEKPYSHSTDHFTAVRS